jgi:hypothetical protein
VVHEVVERRTAIPVPLAPALELSTVISAIQLIVARPLLGSGGEIGYSTTRCRKEPTPTNDAPVRMGTPGVVPAT